MSSNELNQLIEFDLNENCPETVLGEDESEMKELDANTQLKKKSKMNNDEDENEETFESVYEHLPSDLKPLKDCMFKAQGCCLLLVLKQFLKEVYTITDSKIQGYSPTDTAKVNDRPLTSRKTNRKFNPKQIIDYMLRSEQLACKILATSMIGDGDLEAEEKLKRSLVNEYLEFKELIMTIDQEEGKATDENSNANGGGKSIEPAKLSILQQKLLEGIEKTKVRFFLFYVFY